ncbi:TlpA family protein disulfide reductase [Psychroflexus sp. ALD_RP9]|uniref:TlpA family protein disulfide reductase n=1 Tax=Psychroflexus sp. ALD_RP9 TaxID=2777186 RepID=UPI001A8E48F9|nr:redoxin domain-containing protein [Psychroflexus sp. ALD_RP9]QSS96558.1 redoxin domain-containing protein [Psychroflexus sp. ALD_RP9]
MKINIAIYFMLCLFCSAQQNTNKSNNLFFESILNHQKKFSYDIEKAYLSQNFDKVDQIFKNFIQERLINKKMNNFEWSRFRAQPKALYDIKTPIYLHTRSSWCLPSEGEIPTLNKLAKKFKDKLRFVVLFWDKKSKMRKEGRKYANIIDVVYIDELIYKNDYTIKALKHVLGVPVVYLIDEHKKVRLIDRPTSTPFHFDSETSKEICERLILKQISYIIEN